MNHKALGINEQGTIVGITMNASGNLVDSFYHDGNFNINNFTEIMAPFYNPSAGVNNSLLTAGVSGDLATYSNIGPNDAIALAKLLPTDYFAAANALNDQGLIVGISGNKGFIYNAVTGQLQDVNSFLRTGFAVDQINQLTGINNTGFYVGEGTVGGITHGIAGVYTVPEPSSLSLAAFAVSTFLLTSRRQRAGVQALAALRFNRS